MVKVVPINRCNTFTQSCRRCGLSKSCLPAAFDDDVIELIVEFEEEEEEVEVVLLIIFDRT